MKTYILPENLIETKDIISFAPVGNGYYDIMCPFCNNSILKHESEINNSDFRCTNYECQASISFVNKKATKDIAVIN